MDETKESLAFKRVPERLTLGITRILESMPGVVDVRLAEREPAEKRSLLSWEQKNNCILPEDLRDFYLTTDGFTLTWNVKLDNECVPLGCMTINSVERLQPLLQPTPVFSLPNAPSLADLDWEESSAECAGLSNASTPPHFDSRSRIFELDSCGGNGKVCLAYKNSTTGVVAQQSEIWFLDRSLCWHFLTATFSSYYRLMITHLGLPEWQYTFTPFGPSPQAKQWASLYQPLTFRSELSLTHSAGDVNKLDPTKAFKAKAKVPTPKKKPSAPCSLASNGKSPGSVGRPAGVAKR